MLAFIMENYPYYNIAFLLQCSFFLRLALSGAQYTSIAQHLCHARVSSGLSVILHVVHATKNGVCTCETVMLRRLIP